MDMTYDSADSALDPTVRAAEDLLEAAEPYHYPRGEKELRVLELLRQYYPVPLTPAQVAIALNLERADALALLVALATLGTIVRCTKSYYQHIPRP
jgi:predicted Rossmann fold nucleotide-binding protein DprA/Smf involved in DNA uptake